MTYVMDGYEMMMSMTSVGALCAYMVVIIKTTDLNPNMDTE